MKKLRCVVWFTLQHAREFLYLCVRERERERTCARERMRARERARERERENKQKRTCVRMSVYTQKTEEKCERTRVGVFEGMCADVKREKARDTEKKLSMI